MQHTTQTMFIICAILLVIHCILVSEMNTNMSCVFMYVCEFVYNFQCAAY